MTSSRPPRPSAIAEPRDRDLVRLHWPSELRPAFDTLFGIDDALGDAVLKASQPALAAIKLAWWRERLQALDVNPPPAEPRLRAAAAELLPRGISGQEISRLEEGWAELLQPEPDRNVAAGRGETLFALAACLLGVTEPRLNVVGRMWATADLARRTGAAHWLEPTPVALKVARKLRPVSVMAALAARDHRHGFPVEREGSPARAWTLIRHRLTGRI